MNGKLRTTMFVITAYLTVLGVLFLFLPGTAESVMGIELPDAALTMLYGQVVLTLAFLAFQVARDSSLAKASNVFMVLFGGHILVWVYQLATGVSTFAQVGPPLVLSAIFTVLLLMFGRNN